MEQLLKNLNSKEKETPLPNINQNQPSTTSTIQQLQNIRKNSSNKKVIPFKIDSTFIRPDTNQSHKHTNLGIIFI